MREQWSQKCLHLAGGFLCSCALEQIVGAEHHKENIHRCVFGKQAQSIGIAWDIPAVGTGIDPFVTSLLCQQINPTILGTVTVTEKSSGIVAVSIRISETQYSQRNHHLV